MAKWFKFTTDEHKVLTTIVENDVQTTESYEEYLEKEPEGQEVLEGLTHLQHEVLDTVERKVIGQHILDKLVKGGEQHD